jgi:hypothetical protein
MPDMDIPELTHSMQGYPLYSIHFAFTNILDAEARTIDATAHCYTPLWCKSFGRGYRPNVAAIGRRRFFQLIIAKPWGAGKAIRVSTYVSILKPQLYPFSDVPSM